MIESVQNLTFTNIQSTNFSKANQLEFVQSLPFLEDGMGTFVVSGEYRHARFYLGSVFWGVFWLNSSGRTLVRLLENRARHGQDPA